MVIAAVDFLLSSGVCRKTKAHATWRAKRPDKVWNTLAVKFEANAPTMCAKRLAMFPSSLALVDVSVDQKSASGL